MAIRFRPLSHGWSVQVRLSYLSADWNGRSILLYGASDVNGDMSADIRPDPIRQNQTYGDTFPSVYGGSDRVRSDENGHAVSFYQIST